MSYRFKDDENTDWMTKTSEKNEGEECEDEDVDDEESKDEIDAMGQKLEEIKDGEEDAEDASSSEKSRESRPRIRKERKEETEDEKKDVEEKDSIVDKPAIVLTPEQEFNRRFNIVVGITLICVLGLGIGHFLGLTKCSLLESGLNADEIISKLDYENRFMEEEIKRLQSVNKGPIKIKGRDGKESRELRERITSVVSSNEEMRATIMRLKFMTYPDGDKALFSKVLQQNLEYKVAVAKLIHLGPDLNELKESVTKLEAESETLGLELTQLRIQEQPIPRELTGVLKEIDGLKLIVKEASKKKNPPANLANAKSYISLLSQVLSSMTSINNFKEGNNIEKLEMMSDVFSQIAPKGASLPVQIQDKVKSGRKLITEMKNSLANKWDQLKKLTRPDTISTIGHTTLNKMNRVIVNVVSKVKEIGQALLMHRGKTSPDKTIKTLVDKLFVLDTQFEKTWETLETEIHLPEDVQKRIADSELSETNEEMEDDEEDNVAEEEIEEIKEEKSESETQKRKYDKKKNEGEITRGLEKAALKKEPIPEPKKVEVKQVAKPVVKQEKMKPKPVPKVSKPVKEEKNKLLIEEKEKPRKPFEKAVPKADKMKKDERYFKGMYNKDKDGNEEVLPKVLQEEDEDDDEDVEVQGGNKKGIMKHWGKPHKKSYFRETSAPKKQFIRRKDG